MSQTMQYKGYEGSVLFDDEDKLFHGRLLGIRDFILYDGQTPTELETNFRGAVDEYLSFCKEDGKEPEEPFALLPVHFPPDLHRRAAVFAEKHNTDINTVVEQALTKYLERAA